MAYTCAADVKPQEGKQAMLTKMIANQEVDFVLMGGSRFGGKSEILSMIPLLFAGDPLYRGIFFRRSYDEIMGANGLWEKAENQYNFFNAKSNKSDKYWSFPTGAKQFYRHMFNEGDEDSHRGKGYSMVGFDEIDQFTPKMVQMLMTCLRSEAQMDSFLVGTLNPRHDSWCLPLVEYYLDKDGFPDPAKCGEVRWYVVKDDEFLFGPSEEWFKENHPDAVYVTMPNGNQIYTRPKRFTYVFFNIFDNPIGLANNTAYLSELNNLPDHQRMTQLYGNWYAKEAGNSIFRSEWLEEVDEVPLNSVSYRAWDKAYSDDVKKMPDYSASVKIVKDTNGLYYLMGDWKEDLIDTFKKGEDIIYGRFRKLAGQRDQWMIAQSLHDGDDCTVIIPEEGGAGKGEYQQMTKMFIEEGFRVKGAKTGNVKNGKLKRFSSFTSACQNGIIKIVPDSFGNKATYRAFIKELETFDGSGSTGLSKDDWVDCCSDLWSIASVTKLHSAPALPDFNSPTLSCGMYDNIDDSTLFW